MALTQESLTAAARRKTEHAKGKLRTAEDHLALANKELKDAGRRATPAKIEGVRRKTEKAEHEVIEAVEELEVVTELLQQPGTAANDPNRKPASGEGARSLVQHLRKASGP